jgi:predicted RNA binding protein YcfA (HicA-like mRNA interferase family)
MKSVSGKEFARILEQHGWTVLRVQGSHHIYGKAGNDARLSLFMEIRLSKQDC